MSMVTIRQSVERDITGRTIAALLASGFSVIVDNGEERTPALRDPYAISNAMMATDDEYLVVMEDGKQFGWIRLVYGNDGWDVISDYTVNLEDILRPVLNYADSLS